MLIRRVFLASSIAVALAASTAAADNWTYSELNKTIPGAGGNAPEDDARPGEYYFMRGVEAFRGKDYEHAIKMYEVAASWGYKNAQYNLGVMYARGQGIEVDLPRAMAWMALAAERNDKQYVEGRELVYGLLDKEQWAQANTIWRDLKATYSDAVALPRAKARWAEVRNGMTGSHVGSIGHLEVGVPTPHSGLALVGASADGSGNPTDPNSTFGKQGQTAADVAGANTVDGAIAYRELRSTNNPYDPKLQRRFGTATVEPLQPVKDDAPDAAKPTDNAAPAH
jgi:hypothetical protein